MSIPASPDRYRGSAKYYARGRLPYPGGLVEALAKAVKPGAHPRLLDLGCGTGRLSLALAGHYDEVVGVDVDATCWPWLKGQPASGGWGLCRFITCPPRTSTTGSAPSTR